MAKEMMMVGIMAFLSRLKRLVAGESFQMEKRFSEESKPHGKGENGNGQVRDIHGDSHRGGLDPITIELDAMEDTVVDDDDKEKPAAKIYEGPDEVGGPGGNRLDDGVHGKMRAGFHGDTRAEEGHENADVTAEFLKPGKIVMEDVTQDYLDKSQDSDHQKGISQNPFFQVFQPVDEFFHSPRRNKKGTTKTI